jgi:hypothetical protein
MANDPACMCLETSYALSLVLKPFPTCICLDLESPSARLIHRIYRTSATILKPLQYFAKPSNDKTGIVDRFNGIGALGKVSVAGNRVVWSGPELLDSVLPLLAILFYVGIFIASFALVWRVAYGEMPSTDSIRRVVGAESLPRPGGLQNKSATRQQERQGDEKFRSRPTAT